MSLAVAFVAAVAAGGCAREEPRSGAAPERLAERVVLHVAGYEVLAEVARTPEQQRRGLMGRRSLGENEGMLFVYDSERPLDFWMKDTPLPLSIAFLRSDGTIVNIEDMAPFRLETHSSRGPAQYALEMNRGWFAKRGIGPGDRVVLPEAVRGD